MIEYASVIALTPDGVVMIRKNRPDWQKGRLNFPGGHIEKYETAIDAAAREFNEETGGRLKTTDLIQCCMLHEATEFSVTYYQTYIQDTSKLISATDEEIIICPIEDISSNSADFPIVRGVDWALALALDSEIVKPIYLPTRTPKPEIETGIQDN